MNSEEILNMKMLIGHLDLTIDTKNKLYNQTTKIEDELDKYKKALDKIKEYINKTTYKEVFKDDKHSIKEFWFIKDILELLEEIE